MSTVNDILRCPVFKFDKLSDNLCAENIHLHGSITCADPEGGGGTGGPDPPWNLKILPLKKVISGFFGGWTPPPRL